MRRWAMIAAGLIAGVLLSAGLYVAAAPTGVMRPARVAVVDFDRLVREAEQMKTAQVEFQAVQDKLNKEAEGRVARVRELQGKLSMHVRDSDAWRKTAEEIEKESIDNKNWYEMQMRKLLDRQKEVLQTFFRDVQKAAADYARTNGISLVLKVDGINATAEGDPREFRLQVALKKVLYSADDIDITNDLTALLDARHRAGKAGNP